MFSQNNRSHGRIVEELGYCRSGLKLKTEIITKNESTNYIPGISMATLLERLFVISFDVA